MIMRSTYLMICCVMGLTGMAQLQADEKISMTGSVASDRQVSGLAHPSDSASAVSAEVHQSGVLIYSNATGTDTVYLTMSSPTPTAYTPGMVVNFKAAASNTDSMKIDVNGLGLIPLVKYGAVPLDSNDIYAGQLVSAIYDGTNFQVISELNTRCPDGMVGFANQFCIEVNERAPQIFWDAVVTCYEMNLRLCDWNEWYQACSDATLGLADMTNNWEWCDNASNWNTTWANSMVRVAGETDCQDAANGNPMNAADMRNFRCCYSK